MTSKAKFLQKLISFLKEKKEEIKVEEKELIKEETISEIQSEPEPGMTLQEAISKYNHI